MDVLSQQQASLEDFAQPINPVVQLQLSMCKELMQQLTTHQTIDELLAIKQQSDLLHLIQQRLHLRPRQHTFLSESQQSLESSSRFRLLTENTVLKRDVKPRLATQPSDEPRIRKRPNDIHSYLQQVEQKCSREAYEAVCQLVAEHRTQKQKIAAMRSSEMEWQRTTKENVLLKETSGKLQGKVSSLEERIRTQEAQLSHTKKSLNQKERTLTKMQTSLLIKDKLLNENMKSLCTKTEFLKKQEQNQIAERKYLDGVWDTVISKLDSMPGNELTNFKTTVYSKCKQNLLKQRSILQQEQQQLDRQHTYIEKIITQLQGVAPAEVQSVG